MPVALQSFTICVWYNMGTTDAVDDFLLQLKSSTISSTNDDHGINLAVGDRASADITLNFDQVSNLAQRHMYTVANTVPQDTWVYITTTYNYTTGED